MIPLYLMKSSEVRKADDRSILCQHGSGHSLDKNMKLHQMKKEKTTYIHGFSLVFQKIGRFGNILLEH